MERFRSTIRRASVAILGLLLHAQFALAAQHFTIAENTKAQNLNLTNFVSHSGTLPSPAENYNRKKHYGKWFDDPEDGKCQNTRAKVLIRDSEVPVTFTNDHDCTVATGKWYDPYTGDAFYSARDIEIDHMVPLKNSYISGGYEWNSRQRCLYANYTGYSAHLIAASGIENQDKLDHTPEEYMPPNSKYRCEYIKNWLSIKMIWKLRLTDSEKAAIEQEIRNNRCSERMLTMSKRDLQYQRDQIYKLRNYCDVQNLLTEQ